MSAQRHTPSDLHAHLVWPEAVPINFHMPPHHERSIRYVFGASVLPLLCLIYTVAYKAVILEAIQDLASVFDFFFNLAKKKVFSCLNSFLDVTNFTEYFS